MSYRCQIDPRRRTRTEKGESGDPLAWLYPNHFFLHRNEPEIHGRGRSERPGERNAGAHCAAPVSQVDWLPTVLDVIGQEWCEPMPGRSLVPLLDDPGQTWADRAVLSDYACQGTRALMRMVRKGNYKACFAPGFPPTLFDLEADPHEWNDLCRSRDHRAVLAELEQDAGATLGTRSG